MSNMTMTKTMAYVYARINPSLSHIEKECQESLIQGKIYIQKNLNKDLAHWQS